MRLWFVPPTFHPHRMCCRTPDLQSSRWVRQGRLDPDDKTPPGCRFRPGGVVVQGIYAERAEDEASERSLCSPIRIRRSGARTVTGSDRAECSSAGTTCTIRHAGHGHAQPAGKPSTSTRRGGTRRFTLTGCTTCPSRTALDPSARGRSRPRPPGWRCRADHPCTIRRFRCPVGSRRTVSAPQLRGRASR